MDIIADIIERLIAIVLVALVAAGVAFLVLRSVSVYTDCWDKGGVVVKTVEWGDGLTCWGEDKE